ncbi:WXG100 family type VII secretion target [Allokutzneria oryzae]|uniref:WXG100 family type VII secretion target n=1 Tax=Allokutzneria oryzae TaxID=1378989 RepID=A0ABV6A8I0_9PSEU
MQPIGYRFGEVETLGANTKTHAEALKEAFAALMREAMRICGDDWKGAASQAFGEAQQEWNRMADGMGNAQQKFGHQTQLGSQDMQALDQSLTGLFH